MQLRCWGLNLVTHRHHHVTVQTALSVFFGVFETCCQSSWRPDTRREESKLMQDVNVLFSFCIFLFNGIKISPIKWTFYPFWNSTFVQMFLVSLNLFTQALWEYLKNESVAMLWTQLATRGGNTPQKLSCLHSELARRPKKYKCACR